MSEAVFRLLKEVCQNATQSFSYEIKNSHGQEKSDD
jgi:hypothetical protein